MPFSTGLGADGEIIWPTITALVISPGSASSSAARTSLTPGMSSAGVPEARWYNAIMLWVLPPPKLVCSSMTGSPPPPVRRRVAPTRSSVSPSVRYVRAKNAVGSWYSSSAVPLATSYRSAANSAWSNRPDATSACGEMISRQGVSPAWGSPSVGLEAVFRLSARDSSSII